jgi:glycerol-3-phosphate acyltransferase PlsY
MAYALASILSYCFGMINPTLLIGRYIKKVDVRSSNSRNPGTSNAMMTFGVRYGLFVGIFDILKGTIPVLVLRILYPDNDLIWIVAGFSAIMGHTFPLFMKLKGGKGTATFGGVLIGAMPLYALALMFIYFFILFYFDYIAISTLVAVTLTPIYMFYMDFTYRSIALMTVFMVISIYKHMPNYARIYYGHEVGISRAFKKS